MFLAKKAFVKKSYLCQKLTINMLSRGRHRFPGWGSETCGGSVGWHFSDKIPVYQCWLFLTRVSHTGAVCFHFYKLDKSWHNYLFYWLVSVGSFSLFAWGLTFVPFHISFTAHPLFLVSSSNVYSCILGGVVDKIGHLKQRVAKGFLWRQRCPSCFL